MNLYLLRHGLAIDRDPSGDFDDSLRPLTLKGERRVRSIGEGMLRLKLSFDLILSSPYLRAKQTADIVSDVFNAQAYHHSMTALTPDGNPRQLVTALGGRYQAQENILLVGHEPYLSGLISLLVSGSADLHVVMKKGGLCKLSARTIRYTRCATLEWLMTSRHLRLLA
jgi:phosphohistidine phosphatase